MKKVRGFLGQIGLKAWLPEDEEQEELEDELDGDVGGGDPMDVYRVGNGSSCIVWNYDIFGFNGGRTREIADLIASKGEKNSFPSDFQKSYGGAPSGCKQTEVMLPEQHAKDSCDSKCGSI